MTPAQKPLQNADRPNASTANFIQVHNSSDDGIEWFGGGRNCAEARTPHILEIKGIRIALLGYNDFHPRCFEAGPNWPGVAWAVDEQITADIEAARTIHKADLVIPVMHWGDEYDPANDRQRKLARLMIEAFGGAFVIGFLGTQLDMGKLHEEGMISHRIAVDQFSGAYAQAAVQAIAGLGAAQRAAA